ncbi:MAG: hypothetical protein JXR95_11705 [Deltaproteobacteria bacterium]|nr:hypothetical protein [Deltaproteobacteria bacterium]
MKFYFLSTFLVFSYLGVSLSGAAQEPPYYEAFSKALKKKIHDIKREQKFSNNSTRNNFRKKRKNLFKVSLSKKTVNFNKINLMVLPVNPVKLNCNHPNISKGMPTDPTYRQRTVRSSVMWGKDYVWPKDGRSYRGPVSGCIKGVWNLMRAHCVAPTDPEVTKLFKRAQRKCHNVFKRYWIEETYRAMGKPLPMWAKSPKDLKAEAAKRIQWAEMYLKDPSKWYQYMIEYLEILSIYPNNKDAQRGFDFMYSNYFNVTQNQARLARESGTLGGPLSKLSESALYEKAIDELLGKHHSVTGNTPQLGLTYRDVNYLLTMVYLPNIRKNQSEFARLKCSSNLRRRMRAYDSSSVEKEMSSGRLCTPSQVKIKPTDVMTDSRIRLKLIEILSKKTSDPTGIFQKAAVHVARQIGASKMKVCWLYENPYPESIKPTAGPSAHCYSYGFSGYHNVRPGYYNYVYTPIKMKKYTKLQIIEAREMLKGLGGDAASLDKKLAKNFRRAKGEKCLAWDVTIAWDYLGRGRYGKPYRYSNGGPREVSCSKFRRNRTFSKMFKTWNNFFDSVFGGKYNGQTRIVRNRFGVLLRKTKSGLVFVKRKI